MGLIIKHNEIKIFSGADRLFKFAANDFKQRVIELTNNDKICSVVLSGGETGKLFCKALARYKKEIPWQQIYFFFGDERYVALDDVQSNYYNAFENLFSKVDVPQENIYPMITYLKDPKAAAKKYEAILKKVCHLKKNSFPQFDLVYLGLGQNGHTASLMPHSPIANCYSKNPSADNRLAAAFFVPELNMYRISLTPNAINFSKNIIFLVNGKNKAPAVSEVIEGQWDPNCYPAQLIHHKNRTLWYLDKMAASKLMISKKKQNTLAIDVGGTAIKMMVIDSKGKPLTKYRVESTPRPATVKSVLFVIHAMIQNLNCHFDRVSSGFPGVVQNGVIKTAPNMHPSWIGINYQYELQHLTHRPARVGNDADVQGYGDVSGHGVELVITLGTGMGSALFLNGKLVPNLELAHHPFKNNKTYEQILGKAALIKNGVTAWRKNLKQAMVLWQQTFNYDKLYLGGGYAHKINFELPASAKLSDNVEGVLGGIKLWE